MFCCRSLSGSASPSAALESERSFFKSSIAKVCAIALVTLLTLSSIYTAAPATDLGNRVFMRSASSQPQVPAPCVTLILPRPLSDLGLQSLSQELLSLGKFEEAEKEASKIQAEPMKTELFSAIANQWLLKGNLDKAVQLMKLSLIGKFTMSSRLNEFTKEEELYDAREYVRSNIIQKLLKFNRIKEATDLAKHKPQSFFYEANCLKIAQKKGIETEVASAVHNAQNLLRWHLTRHEFFFPGFSEMIEAMPSGFIRDEARGKFIVATYQEFPEAAQQLLRKIEPMNRPKILEKINKRMAQRWLQKI